jgi:sialidase-1
VGECSIAERSDGSIYANHRTSADPTRKTERMHNVSTDGGISFKTCTYSGLADARCHAGLATLTEPSGQRLFLFTNVPGPKRTGLTISISEDEGRTWTPKRVIERGHSAYSDIAVLPDRTILCVHETGEQTSRRDLALARFNLAWILNK